MSERTYYAREVFGRVSVFYVTEARDYEHGSGYKAAPVNLESARPATEAEIAEFEQEEKTRQERLDAMKEAERKEAERLEPIYGFDPRKVGLRPRGFGEEDGELVICARDGGGNEPDCNAGSFGNYLGSECDDFDCTYRYYRYSPIKDNPKDKSHQEETPER